MNSFHAPTLVLTWAGAMLLAVMVIGGMMFLKVLSRVFSRSNGHSSDSPIRALAVTGVLCAGLLVFVTTLTGVRTSRMVHQESARVTVGQAVDQDTVSLTPEGIIHISSDTADEHVSVSISPEGNISVAQTEDLTAETADESLNEEANAEKPSVKVRQTADGEMLVLPLSDRVLSELLGKEAAQAIAHLNESVPPELRQAYAMIPIPGPGPRTVPPVVHGALGPAVIQHALSPTGLNILRQAVAELVSDVPENADEALTKLESEYTPPVWLKNPGVGRVVIESDFEDVSVSAEEALRPKFVEALEHHFTTYLAKVSQPHEHWKSLVSLKVTDQAIRDCIVETDTRTEVVGTTEQIPMRQTVALVEFPDSLQTHIADDVQDAQKRSRMTALLFAVGFLWLCALLMSVATRVGQSPSFLRKLATVPAIVLLIVPCVAMFVALANLMINGDSDDLRWSKHRVVCVIDEIER